MNKNPADAWRNDCSPEYLAAYDKHTIASKAYREACGLYVSRKIDDYEFDNAVDIWQRADDEYFIAFKAESERSQ